MAAGALVAGPADAPPVVLIHGLGGSHHTWDRVVPLIGSEACVYALDLRGSDSIETEAILPLSSSRARRCSSAALAGGWSRPRSPSDTDISPAS